MINYRRLLWIVWIMALLPNAKIFAQNMPKFSLEFRTDAEWQDSNDERSLNNSAPVLRFLLSRATFSANGGMDNKLGYAIKMQYNQSFEEKVDHTSPALETWYIKYQVNPNISLRAGKHFMHQGGREGTLNPIDVYRYSLVGERVQQLYDVGLSAYLDLNMFGMPDHTVIVQTFNQSNGGNEDQYYLSYNVAWFGTLANGFVEPILAYAMLPHEENVARDTTTQKRVVTQEGYVEILLSLGFLVNLDPLYFQFDYLSRSQDGYKQKNITTGITKKVQQTEDVSYVISASQEKGMFKPFLKYIFDDVKQSTTASFSLKSQTELQLGTEFFPKKENLNFRVHGLFAYHQVEQVDNKYTETRLNCGVMAKF